MNLSLEGKNAVICGSTQGIGLAIAEELALLGANCTLLARNEEALKEAVQLLDIALRQKHGYLVADFSKPEEVREIIAGHVVDRRFPPALRTPSNRIVSPFTHSEDQEPARKLAGGNTIDLLKGICEYSYNTYLVQKETKVFN